LPNIQPVIASEAGQGDGILPLAIEQIQNTDFNGVEDVFLKMEENKRK
jgi:hypothetical protein